MSIEPVVRLFVASPSDATREREIIGDCVAEINLELEKEGFPEYELVGYHDARGTARRPQEAINSLIGDCDFMLVIFRTLWGTDAGGPLGYTSGTEEELFTGLLALQDKDHPMRDLWLAFTGGDASCAEIQALRQQIEANHVLLYEAPIDDDEFRARVKATLKLWRQPARKQVRNFELVPSSGRDVLGADRKRREGELLVDMGLVDVGLERLRVAARDGGPSESIALARVLARRGNYDAAIQQCDEVVAQLTSTESALRLEVLAETYAYRADLLRRNGNALGAIGGLQLALEQVPGSDDYTSKIRCRILDNLALAHQRRSEFDDAGKRLVSSWRDRVGRADAVGIVQSHINFARLAVAEKDYDGADRHSEDAVNLLDTIPTQPLHANAYLARAQALLRIGDATRAAGFAERALILNRQFGGRVAEAMSLNVLAQIADALGDPTTAREYAAKCIDLNKALGNSQVPHNLEHLLPDEDHG